MRLIGLAVILSLILAPLHVEAQSGKVASTLPRGLRQFNVLGEDSCVFGIATTLPASLGVFRARRQAPAMALMTSSTPPRGWPIESLALL